MLRVLRQIFVPKTRGAFTKCAKNCLPVGVPYRARTSVMQIQNRRTAEALYKATQAERAAAASAQDKARLADGALAIRERSIGVLEAKLLQAQARLSKTQAELEGATIRAPEDGAIVRRIVQAGGSVKVGQPIISMWLGNDIWIEAWIDEDDIADVKIGNSATVTLHSFPGPRVHRHRRQDRPGDRLRDAGI